MRNKLQFIFLSLFALISISISGQNKQDIDHTFSSTAFGTERTVKVFLPERYFRDSVSEYIVIYVLDAHDDQVWNMAKGNIDYMVSRYTVIPMMAVGIASEDRGSEFNPNSTELHKHFKEEVFPLIDSTYRVSSHRTIVGHSWGGAFVGNTLFSEHADMFDAYIGISPSFGALDNDIYKQADSLFQLKKDFRKYLYFSAGTVGFEYEYEAEVYKMDSILKSQKPTNLVWDYKIFDGKDHFSGLIPGLNDGLVAMSRNYFADQKHIEDFAKHKNKTIAEQLDQFNKHKEDIFGYAFKPSANYLKYVADEIRDKDQLSAAIEIYQLCIDMEENHMRAYFNLADTYFKADQLELAEKTFQKSLSLLEEQKSSVSERFYNNMKEWANEQLEKCK